ncbi:MAG: sigma 54-interacting transcriptional regulator [Deltaproteobacteria bacterium]|nr:sigma 54-interacting transcriptional regulator [Deltaproteobacteria bacterium]
MPQRLHAVDVNGFSKAVSIGGSPLFGKYVEGTMLTKEDLEFPVELSRSIWKTSKGMFVTSIIRDITERKKVEEEVRKTNADLEQEVAEHEQTEEELRKALKEIERLKEQLQADYTYLREEIKLEHNFNEIIGVSNALKYVLFKIEQIANIDTTILVLGETGTGKELVARAIHNMSPRKNRPLVKVDCATLPPNLIESELFGHEKGSFTGSQERTIGRFELAHGSTIFLDEIGELPLVLQSKLLRVIQDGEFERIGSSSPIKVDVRIIAATNRNLENEIRKGNFRQDLWYRLNVFPITVPPLRQRVEDIPLLVHAFVNKFSKKIGKTIEKVTKDDMRILKSYSWPGNVRELQNVIERSVINTQGSLLCLTDKLEVPLDAERTTNRKKHLKIIEHDYILNVLEETKWKIEGENGAAAILGLNPSTLRSRMRNLGIRR